MHMLCPNTCWHVICAIGARFHCACRVRHPLSTWTQTQNWRNTWLSHLPSAILLILSVWRQLQTNFANYEKSPESKAIFHELLGQGLFNSDGDMWRLQRKAASHLFMKVPACRYRFNLLRREQWRAEWRKVFLFLVEQC